MILLNLKENKSYIISELRTKRNVDINKQKLKNPSIYMLYMKLNFKEYIIGAVVSYYWVFVGFLCVFVYVMCLYIATCFTVKKKSLYFQFVDLILMAKKYSIKKFKWQNINKLNDLSYVQLYAVFIDVYLG